MVLGGKLFESLDRDTWGERHCYCECEPVVLNRSGTAPLEVVLVSQGGGVVVLRAAISQTRYDVKNKNQQTTPRILSNVMISE